MLHRNNAYVSSKNRKKRVINGVRTTRHIIRKYVVLKPISKIILLFYSLPRAEASASRSSVVLHVYVIFFSFYTYFYIGIVILVLIVVVMFSCPYRRISRSCGSEEFPECFLHCCRTVEDASLNSGEQWPVKDFTRRFIERGT